MDSDYLHYSSDRIYIDGAISPTAPIAIELNSSNNTQLTNGWTTHMGMADPDGYFTLVANSESSGKGLGIVNGEVCIGTLHDITLQDNITASATSAAQGKPITLGYTGTPAGYAPIYSATAGSVNGNILVMPDEDVTVSVIFRLAIPYSYGFEEEGSWNEWSNLSGSNERVQNITHNGNYKLLFKGSTNNIEVLPQFQYEANTLQVNFWSRPESINMSKCGTFSVGYLTEPADASTFVALKTYNYNDWTADEYLQKTVYLNNVPDGARIAFRHNPENDKWYWYVDDVEVIPLPSCIPPVDLAVSGIGASAATFSWDAAEGADWEYGIIANAAPNYVPTDADFTGTTTDNSVTLNTLSQLTSYTFYVRRACSAQDKSAVASVSFSTTQTPVAVPFNDDFEGNACQWALENGNAVNQWCWGNAASCGGTKALYISNDGGNSNSVSTNSSTTVYATKMFTFADGDYYFSYTWRCNRSGDLFSYMRVALAPASASLPSNWSYSGSNLPDGWIALNEGYTLNFSSSWQAYQSDAITIPAGQYKMVVVWTNSNNGSPQTYPAAIDNISISTGIKTFTTAGSWNEASNWSPEGVPASTEHVRINAAATIPSGCVAEAAGIFIDYNNGSLTLADGGQLVCYHDLSVTVQKAIAAYTTDKNGWNLFAMPFSSGQHPNSINGLIPSDPSTVYDLYRLKEETTYWENYKQHGDYFFIRPIDGNGACLYATSVGATLQRKDQIYPISVAGVTAQLLKQGEGWHLIANPYTCTAYVNKPFFRMNAEGSALEYVANYWETPLNVCEGIVVKAENNYEPVTFTRTAPAEPSSTPATMADILLQLPSTHGFGEDNAAVTIISDNADNSTVIAANQGSGRTVILSGRTLWKDGAWNTLCLPFNLTLSGSVLDGDNVDVCTLSSSTFSNGTLTLNFTAGGAVTTLTAGTPYIIKWESGDNLTSPVFTDVTISNATNNVTTDYVDFKGTYAPISYAEDNRSILLVGGNNLYYPQSGASLNACRAYFQLNGITAGDPNSSAPIQNVVLNFDGETTEIRPPSISPEGENTEASPRGGLVGVSWYDLSGRKLDKQPTQKGIYIHNRRKVVIK